MFIANRTKCFLDRFGAHFSFSDGLQHSHLLPQVSGFTLEGETSLVESQTPVPPASLGLPPWAHCPLSQRRHLCHNYIFVQMSFSPPSDLWYFISSNMKKKTKNSRRCLFLCCLYFIIISGTVIVGSILQYKVPWDDSCDLELYKWKWTELLPLLYLHLSQFYYCNSLESGVFYFFNLTWFCHNY